MPKSMAKDLLPVLNRLSDDKSDIVHLLIPRCKATGTVYDDILQGLELSFDSLIDSEGYFIVDVILKVVVISDDFCDIVSVIHCGFE